MAVQTADRRTSSISSQGNASGPFFTFREAAAYCGYQHPDSFARMLREEGVSLPACGPRRNRYARSILDDFMFKPDAYRASGPARTPRHVLKPVTTD